MTQRIAFFHPDLGIGGAERLVIDAAVGLQERGHKVTIFTSHCDPGHCFDEARDGTLDVRVRGNSVVPPTLFGRFAILCAILRQVHLMVHVAVWSSELADLKPTAFFVDQLSAGIPLLRVLAPNARIIFYCHFPDKLLAKKGGFAKTLYRAPFDWLESWSTGCSDTIVVNSKFTRTIFRQAFPGLSSRKPEVVYPCVDTEAPARVTSKALWTDKKIVLSINRFEKKKDVALAVQAFARLAAEERRKARLVIAGGYDARVAENVITHRDLCELATTLRLEHATADSQSEMDRIDANIQVVFLRSISEDVKSILLQTAKLLVYTPLHEHFGIVPLEAMLAGTPVLAANEGGPTETVVNGQTGWLRDVRKVQDWTEVLSIALEDGDGAQRLEQMGRRGRERVMAEFSKERMAETLEAAIDHMAQKQRPLTTPLVLVMVPVALVGALAAFTLWRILRSAQNNQFV